MALIPQGGILGERLDRLMKAKGHTPRSLSLAAGLSADSARNILTGRSQRPNKETLDKLAAALGVEVEQLVDTESPADAPLRSPGNEIREFDLRSVDKSDGDLRKFRPPLALWHVPADLLASRNLTADNAVIVRAEGNLEGVVTGDRLIVDLSKHNRYPPGLVVVYVRDSGEFDLARILPDGGVSGRGAGGMYINLEFHWGTVQWQPSDIDLVGRVVGKWLWL